MTGTDDCPARAPPCLPATPQSFSPGHLPARSAPPALHAEPPHPPLPHSGSPAQLDALVVWVPAVGVERGEVKPGDFAQHNLHQGGMHLQGSRGEQQIDKALRCPPRQLASPWQKAQAAAVCAPACSARVQECLTGRAAPAPCRPRRGHCKGAAAPPVLPPPPESPGPCWAAPAPLGPAGAGQHSPRWAAGPCPARCGQRAGRQLLMHGRRFSWRRPYASVPTQLEDTQAPSERFLEGLGSLPTVEGRCVPNQC